MWGSVGPRVGAGGDLGWGRVGTRVGLGSNVMNESFTAPDAMKESFMASGEPSACPQAGRHHPE